MGLGIIMYTSRAFWVEGGLCFSARRQSAAGQGCTYMELALAEERESAEVNETEFLP